MSAGDHFDVIVGIALDGYGGYAITKAGKIAKVRTKLESGTVTKAVSKSNGLKLDGVLYENMIEMMTKENKHGPFPKGFELKSEAFGKSVDRPGYVNVLKDRINQLRDYVNRLDGVYKSLIDEFDISFKVNDAPMVTDRCLACSVTGYKKVQYSEMNIIKHFPREVNAPRLHWFEVFKALSKDKIIDMFIHVYNDQYSHIRFARAYVTDSQVHVVNFDDGVMGRERVKIGIPALPMEFTCDMGVYVVMK